MKTTKTNRAIFLSSLPYLLILALQLKFMWGIWQYKDLASGDTANYFLNACRFAYLGHLNFFWSPFYAIYGALLWKIWPNPYFWCIGQRLILCALMSLAVLRYMRILLPPRWAFLAAAWWVALPINFDTLYEIHMFAALSLTLCLTLSNRCDQRWMRALLCGLLAILAFGVRNEIGVIGILFSLGCLIYETRISGSVKEKLRPYAMSGLVAAACIGALYFNDDASAMLKARIADYKHRQNIAQIYAYGVLQRHPEQIKDPWLGYLDLNTKTFGKAEPTLFEAIKANPNAMKEHFLWNIRLIPAGLQVMLFNATAYRNNPDYVAVVQNPNYAKALSLLVAMIVISGLFASFKDIASTKNWLRQRFWTIYLSICMSSVCVLVMIVQRPRPSYLFALELTLIAAIVFLAAKAASFIRIKGHSLFDVVFALLLIGAAPCYYVVNRSDRPMLMCYRLLKPVSDQIFESEKRVLVPNFPYELQSYLSPVLIQKLIGLSYDQLHETYFPSTSNAELFRQYNYGNFIKELSSPKTNWVIVDKSSYGAAEFIKALESASFEKIGTVEKKYQRYCLYAASD